MTINLSQQDFRTIVEIVQNIPSFANSDTRRDLVKAAFQKCPQASTILAMLDLEGSPMSAAVEVVRFLCRFGKAEEDKEALGIFLAHINSLPSVDATFTNELFQKYSFGKIQEPIKAHPIKTTEVAYCSKVLLFKQIQQEKVCIAIQGEISPGTDITNTFTTKLNVLENFDPVGCSFKTLENIHDILRGNQP